MFLGTISGSRNPPARYGRPSGPLVMGPECQSNCQSQPGWRPASQPNKKKSVPMSTLQRHLLQRFKLRAPPKNPHPPNHKITILQFPTTNNQPTINHRKNSSECIEVSAGGRTVAAAHADGDRAQCHLGDGVVAAARVRVTARRNHIQVSLCVCVSHVCLQCKMCRVCKCIFGRLVC